MVDDRYTDAIRDRDPAALRRRVDAPVLAGLAQWGEEHGTVVSLGLSGDRPGVGGDERGALVAVAGRGVALAAATAPEDPAEVVWTTDPGAVRGVLESLTDVAASSREAAAALGSVSDAASSVDVGSLIGGLAASVAADRQALAAALHDGPVQHLTAAQLLLDSAMWSGQEIPPTAREPIEQGLAALLQGIGGCRDLMRRLAEAIDPPEES